MEWLSLRYWVIIGRQARFWRTLAWYGCGWRNSLKYEVLSKVV